MAHPLDREASRHRNPFLGHAHLNLWNRNRQPHTARRDDVFRHANVDADLTATRVLGFAIHHRLQLHGDYSIAPDRGVDLSRSREEPDARHLDVGAFHSGRRRGMDGRGCSRVSISSLDCGGYKLRHRRVIFLPGDRRLGIPREPRHMVSGGNVRYGRVSFRLQFRASRRVAACKNLCFGQ